MDKVYITAEQLLEDSFKLALLIYESGYRPDYIVGVWRGGAPVGIAVQEFFDYLGVECDHIAIRTSSYNRSNERSKHVNVHGLNYIISRVESEQSLLIVDDVHDSGMSVQAIIEQLSAACTKNTPDIKVATPYYKPRQRISQRTPDFYIHETDSWLVFPHELHGLTPEEISERKPGIDAIRATLLAHSSEGKIARDE